MAKVEIYQSVLEKLSHIPVEHLKTVDDFLSDLFSKIEDKKSNQASIMSFAGSWSDMKQEDFEDFLKKSNESGNELFSRKIDLL